jgi:ParB/RepB/Spo0J family partition protein
MTTHPPHAQANGAASIAAAMPVAAPLAYASDGEYQEIPLELLDDDDNPRTHSDDEQDRALAKSIATHGLFNPVTVYRDPESKRFKLARGGGRRSRACLLLGWKNIPAFVLGAPPDEINRRESALIENEQRQDLSDIERGLAYLDYMTRTGCTASALAEKLCKSVSTITRAVALIRKLPEDLREAVGSEFPSSVAEKLTSLPDDDAKRHFAALYREGKVKSGAELAAAIRAAKTGQAAGGLAGFSCEEQGVRISVTWTSGATEANSEQPPAAVEQALKTLLKDLREQGHRGLEPFKQFLNKKARTAKKAAELAAAQDALARHSTPDKKAGN